MYTMRHDVQIGAYKLLLIDSINIKKSVDTLSDTAVISLPAIYLNKDIDIEGKIQQGDIVLVSLGYDNTLMQEFKGYVHRIRRKDTGIEIECENDMYLFRKVIKNKQYKNVTVKQLLTDICKQVGMKFSCTYDFSYETFTIKDAQAIDVLQKIQSECGCSFYVFNGILTVEPKYYKTYNKAIIKYNFSRNIERGTTNLEWMNEREIFVKVTGTNRKGQKIEATAGRESGATDKVTINIPGVSDVKMLKARADETLAERNHPGYSGKFNSWLVPFCDKAFKIKLIDETSEYKGGNYYVKSVEVNYSQNGGIRTIELGKRLSNG